MERHHEVAMQQALDKVYLEGAACIRWDYLYLWFNAARLNKGSYRELHKRWDEVCTITHGLAAAPELSVLNGTYTLTLMRGAFPNETIEPLANWI